MSSKIKQQEESRRPDRWFFRLAIVGICLLGIVTITVTNSLLTQRFTASTSTRADVRLTLYVASLMSELQRN